MAGGDQGKSDDYYAVLGLEKECTQFQLRNAYKKLAMRWHPDRCSASASSKFVEEANKKFQAIQQAYAVLSDETKRIMYYVGVYDNDDDQNNHGMGDFLNEIATMMSENKPSENGEESFEQLQELFVEMFQNDAHEAFTSTSRGMSSCSSSYVGSMESSCINSKRNSSEPNNTEGVFSFNAHLQSFCVGAEYREDRRKGKGRSEGNRGEADNHSSRWRQGRKQKVASDHDVSCNDFTGISTWQACTESAL